MDNEEELMSDIKKLLGVKKKPQKSRKEIMDKLYTILNMATSKSKSENNTALKKAEQYIKDNNIKISEIDVEKLYDKDAVMDFIINHYYVKPEKQEEKQKFIEHIMPLTKREEIFQKMAKSVEVYKPQQRQEQSKEREYTRAEKPDWTAGQGYSGQEQSREREHTRSKKPRIAEEQEYSEQVSMHDVHNVGKSEESYEINLKSSVYKKITHSLNIIPDNDRKADKKNFNAIIYGEISSKVYLSKKAGFKIFVFAMINEHIGTLVTDKNGFYKGKLIIPKKDILSQNNEIIKPELCRDSLPGTIFAFNDRHARVYVIKTTLKIKEYEHKNKDILTFSKNIVFRRMGATTYLNI
jgi:hypothetical protein